MNEKRKKVEDYIYKIFTLMEPGKTNVERIKSLFAAMDDTAFNKWMQSIKDKKRQLVFYAPNLKVNLLIKDLLAAAKACNCICEEQLVLKDDITNLEYTPPNTFMVLRLPIRRTRQYLMHKLSISEDDKKIDALTGQVTQESKSSKLSGIEAQLLYGRGLTETITEFYKVRGGDIPAYANFKQQIAETGQASMTALDPNTVPRSTMTVGLMLTCMHIDNNFVEKPDDGK
jgi:hypothetical protein